MLGPLKPKEHSTIPFLVFISFLVWFVLARLWVELFPSTVIRVRGIHVHHYAYGIIMLSVLSFIFLSYQLPRIWRLRFAPLLGIALASAYDEFAMWLLLENAYQSRTSIDAIIIVSLIMANAVYFPRFWAKWGKRLGRLLSLILFGTPRFTYRTFKKILTKLLRSFGS